MTDEHGHELLNYYEVRLDEDILAAGNESLIAAMRAVGWDGTRVWWCPICKTWTSR